MSTLAITIPFQGESELNAALALLTAIDVVQLKARAAKRRKYPALYESGVRYTREARGKEEWQCADEIFARKTADCEDLACLRSAELIVAGEKAVPHAYKTPSGGWHIVVRRANGTLEDPSARLGMNR